MSSWWKSCVVLGFVLASWADSSQAQMTVVLKSEKGYVGTTISGRVEAHDDLTTRSCVFYLEDHGDAGNGERYVALRDAYSNKYLVAQDDGSVYSNRDQRGGWETWVMADNGNGTFAFRSDHGKYLVADEDHAVRANRDGIGPWESFEIVRMQHLGCWDDHSAEDWAYGWETKDGKPVCGIPPAEAWACQSREGLEMALNSAGLVETRFCPDPVQAVVLISQAKCKWWSEQGTRTCEVSQSPVTFFAPPWQTRTFDQHADPMIVGNQGAEFDGQTSLTVGRYRLPSAFALRINIDRIDSDERWRHLLELGAVEHGWNSPLRIETGQEGELYVSLGDGSKFAETTFEQVWTRGGSINELTLAYDYARRGGNLYGENGYIGTLVADLDPSAVDGTMILGSHKGVDRFFAGRIGHVLAESGAGDAGRETPVLNLRSGWLGFDGASSLNVSQGGIEYKLSDTGSFTAKGEIMANAAAQWVHLIELGTLKYGWNSPLRIEIGNAGEWYVSMGDGSAFTEKVFQGSWSPGNWVSFHFSFDGSSNTGSLYENGVHLGDIQVPTEGVGLVGELILGSFRGQERFFDGEMRNLYIADGVSTP